MKIAVYPGSFDPITNGHISILKRSVEIFDKVILLLAVNPNKSSTFSKEERLQMMKEAVKDIPNVEVDYDPGLVVNYCVKKGAKHIIRGLRAVSDFEYEFQLAAANEYANPDIDMVFFMARANETFVSSSAVNELHKNNVDIAKLVPPVVLEYYKQKK